MRTLLGTIGILSAICVAAALPANLTITLERSFSPPNGGVALYACEKEVFRNNAGGVDSVYFTYFNELNAKMHFSEDSVTIQIPEEWNRESLDSTISLTVNRYDLAVATGEISDPSVNRDMKWDVGTIPSNINGAPRFNAFIQPCPNVKQTVDSLMFLNALCTQITIGNAYKANLPNGIRAEVNHLGRIPKRFKADIPAIWFRIENEPGFIAGCGFPEIYDGFQAAEQRTFGDLIRLSENEYYRIDSIDSAFEQLYLSRVENPSGKIELPEAVKSLLSPYLKQAESEHKFILIDFWGTWCGPCVKSMPRLKVIEETYHDKLQTISICVDMNSKRERANHLLDSKGVSAIRLFEPMQRKEGESPIVDALDVRSMPTYILLKPTGEIMLRGSGEGMLQYVTRILDSLE